MRLLQTKFHLRESQPSGFSLVYAIAGLVLLSSIAATITALTSSAALTNLATPNEQCAYYLALSGLNYWSNGKTGAYALGNGTFTLTQSGPDKDGYYAVTSLGTVQAGAPGEANFLLTARKPGIGPITFENDIADFLAPTPGSTATNPYAVIVFDKDLDQTPDGMRDDEWLILWSENVNRYAGGWVRLASGLTNSHGALWYNGDHGVCTDGQCQEGTCENGRCRLGKGLRAYFVFSFSEYDTSATSTDHADGFTFTVATAENDPATAAGGPASGSRGEYLGYAGPGPAGKGIKAPKLAVEIDVYPNKTKGAPKSINSRADAGNDNHVALVYWGTPDTLYYDDNVHGAGNNPAADSSGYYRQAKPADGPNWLEDGREHAMRIELHRQDESAGGSYRVRVWIDPRKSGCDNVAADFTDEAPKIDHTASLAAADHAGMDAIRFGWTEGTGEQVQTVALHDFSLDFRR